MSKLDMLSRVWRVLVAVASVIVKLGEIISELRDLFEPEDPPEE
jgi:hypothetical protein